MWIWVRDLSVFFVDRWVVSNVSQTASKSMLTLFESKYTKQNSTCKRFGSILESNSCVKSINQLCVFSEMRAL